MVINHATSHGMILHKARGTPVALRRADDLSSSGVPAGGVTLKTEDERSDLAKCLGNTVDGRNPANQLIGSLSRYSQGFIHSNGDWEWNFWTINSTMGINRDPTPKQCQPPQQKWQGVPYDRGLLRYTDGLHNPLKRPAISSEGWHPWIRF